MKKLKKERRKYGKSKNKGDTSTSTSPSCSTSVETSQSTTDDDALGDSDAPDSNSNKDPKKHVDALEKQCWTKPLDIEDKSREEEFDEYLEDLLL